MKSAVGLLVIAGLAIGCAPAASGAVGTLSVSGGPPGHVSGGEPVALIVTAPGKPTIQVSTTGGTSTRIALEPGDYIIAGQYGNAGCSSATLNITAGSWASFQLVCSIR